MLNLIGLGINRVTEPLQESKMSTKSAGESALGNTRVQPDVPLVGPILAWSLRDGETWPGLHPFQTFFIVF